MKIIAIIPARGGSKGFPGKNIANFMEKPLISWPINAALSSEYISDVYVSTDAIEIAEVAKKYGAKVPWLRPEHLASDDSLRSEAIIHALDNLPDCDIFVYLEPTSPLTDSLDIDKAISTLIKNERAESCVTVTEMFQYHPSYCVRKDSKDFITPWHLKTFEDVPINRQLLEPAYFFDGSLYISYSKSFKTRKEFYHDRTIAIELDSYKHIEIDDIKDLKIAEEAYEQKIK